MKRKSELLNIWKNLFKPNFYKLEYDGIIIGIVFMTIAEKDKLLSIVNNHPLLKIIEDKTITNQFAAKACMTDVAIMNRLLGFAIDK